MSTAYPLPRPGLPWMAMSGDEDAPRPRGHRRRHRGGPRGRGPGFGPWPGFGPGARGPRARRGDVRTAVLALLAEQPRHGYQLIQDIAERTDGAWRPSAGAVYPALAQLEDEGLIRAEEQDGRKVFHLTEAGTAHVAERTRDIEGVWDAVGGLPESTVELMDLGRQLAIAVQEVLRSGTDDQVRQARSVLADARRSMYLILADESPGDDAR